MRSARRILVLGLVIISACFAVVFAQTSDSGESFAPVTALKNYYVDPYTGSANFSIPLFIPAAHKTLPQKLNLVYSSRPGNGWLGAGWKLDLGVIERSTKNGYPKYDSTDKFVFSLGREQNDLVCVGGQEYRPQSADISWRFVFDGRIWTVNDNLGNTYYFGLEEKLTDFSRTKDPKNSSKIFRWRISKITDTSGNSIIYKYLKDKIEIYYTEKSQSVKNSYNQDDYNYLVQINFSGRGDQLSNCRPGFCDDYPLTGKGRVEEIKLFYQKQLFKTYALVYEYSLVTGRSLLKEIQECYPDKSGQKNPAVVKFSYNETRPVYETIVNENLPAGDKLWNMRMAQVQKPAVKEDDRWWLTPKGFRIDYHSCGGRIDPVDWSQTYVQNQGDNAGLSWTVEANGNIKIKGKKGRVFHIWTYVTVKKGENITLSPVENCNVKIFQAGDYAYPWEILNLPHDPPVTIYNTGYTANEIFKRIDITGYNFDADFSFDLRLGLAEQAEVMNSQEAVIPQLSGDFNGDGVSDLGTFYKETGKCEIISSVMNDCSDKKVWIENFGKGAEIILGDFNGDGKTDLCTFGSDRREWRVALSDGTKFINQGVWLKASLIGRIVTGDFNGDGLTDIGHISDNSGQGTCWVALSNGKGFNLQEGATMSSGSSWLGDYNGDGITDFGWVSETGVTKIEGYKGTWYRTVGFGITRPHFSADTDGDGRASFCQFQRSKASGQYYFYIYDHNNIENNLENIGNNLSAKNAIYGCKYEFSKVTTNINSGDFNGDGLVDFIVYDLAGRTELALSASNFPDVLTSVQNGWGGRIELEYKPSACYENLTAENKWGLPFSIPVVSRIRVFDRADSFQETVYSYAQGYYDLGSREFRGFGYTSSRDQEGNTSETYFLQDDIYKGKISRQTTIDQNGKVISEVKNTWNNTSPSSGVYIISLKENSRFINDGSSANEKKTNFEYDAYGNRTKQKEWGDIHASGDERETIIEYAYNKSDWLISYPRHIFVQDANKKKVSEKWLYYDGAADNNAAPKKGLLSKEEILISNPLTQKDNTAVFQYSYDGFGNLSKLIDAQNHITSYEYDPVLFTYQTKITNAQAQVSQYSYDLKTGLVLTSTDANNQTIKNVYDGLGRLTKVIGPDDSEDNPGIVYEYEFAGASLPISYMSFEEWEFDSVYKTITPCGWLSPCGWRSWDSKILEYLSREKVEKLSGVCSLKVSPAWKSIRGETTRISQFYTYPRLARDSQHGSNDRVTFSCWVKSSLANQVRIGLNSTMGLNSNNIWRSTDGHREESDYHSGNGEWQLLSVSIPAPAGFQNCMTIGLIPALEIQRVGTADPAVYFDRASFYSGSYKDSQVRLIKRVRTNYDSDNTGKPQEERYSDYLETISFYDGLGRVILIESLTDKTNPQTQAQIVIASDQTVYNHRGQVKEKYLPYFTDKSYYYIQDDLSNKPKWTYEYDCLGRLTKTTNPDGTDTQNIYSGWTTAAIDEKGNRTVSTQDSYGKTIEVEEKNANQTYTTTYAYDILGNLIKITDNENNRTEWTYDSIGRKLKVIDPDMGTWNYEYDPAGNLIKQTDAAGQIIQFEYDQINRLTQKIFVGTGLAPVRYEYDGTNKNYCIGRLSKVTDSSGSSEFFYDKLGREIKSIKTAGIGPGLSVKREYDALSRVTKLTYPDGEIVNYSYNRQGIEKIFSVNSQGTVRYVKDINYSAAGQISAVEYGNAVSTSYTYDPDSLRLTNILTQSPQGKLQDLNYKFDSAGNVTDIQDYVHTSSQSFSYDGLNRLTNAQGNYGAFNYSYDSLGNLTNKEGIGFSYNKTRPHAVSSTSDGTTFEYDANGNLTRKTGKQGAQRFVYNRENRLIKVEETSGDSGSEPAIKTLGIFLRPGLNYISLPFGQSRKIKDLPASIQSSREEIAYWDAARKKYLYNVNNPDFDQFDSIEYAKAYWIYINNSKGVTWNITGKMPDSYQADLTGGWNSIGYVKDTESDVEKGLAPLQLGSDYTCVRRYNSDGKWQEYSAAKKEFTKLKPGEGYWINMAKAAQWNINNTPGRKTVAEFSYDYSGSRVKKTASAKTTVYVDALYEQDSDGTVRKHIFLGANRICTVTSASSQPKAFSYYHSDHLGSSNVITDESGNQAELAEYTPFGSFAKNEPVTGKPVNYFYTGKELDSSTNLYYYGARYYSHTIGKFTQPDPLIQNIYDPQTLNHYSYCRNNPLILIDPTGTIWEDTYNSWSSNFSSDWNNFWESVSNSGNSYWNSLSFGVTNAFQYAGGFWGMGSSCGVRNNPLNYVDPWELQGKKGTELSQKDFYDEMKYVLSSKILPLDKGKSREFDYYLIDSVFWSDDSKQQQSYEFLGRTTKGHELNYYVQGMLYKHYDLPELACYVLPTAWKARGTIIDIFTDETKGYTFPPNDNVFYFTTLGYNEYESLKTLVEWKRKN